MQDDLIFLPSKISSSMGHLGPLVLCTRAMNTLHFMEPNTLRSTQVEVSHLKPTSVPAFCETHLHTAQHLCHVKL